MDVTFLRRSVKQWWQRLRGVNLGMRDESIQPWESEFRLRHMDKKEGMDLRNS